MAALARADPVTAPPLPLPCEPSGGSSDRNTGEDDLGGRGKHV